MPTHTPAERAKTRGTSNTNAQKQLDKLAKDRAAQTAKPAKNREGRQRVPWPK